MKYSTLLGSLACCLALTSGAYAQEDVLRPGTIREGSLSSPSAGRSSSSSRMPIALGVDLGVNYNIFSQNVDYMGTSTAYKVFESGAGFSPFFDIYLDMGIAQSLGVQLKLSYDMKNFSHDMNNEETCFVQDEIGVVGDTTAVVENNWDVTSVSYAGIAALLRINITDSFIATIGPTVHFAISEPESELTRTVLSPDSCYFNFGLPTQSKQISSKDTLDNGVSARVGIDVALGYKIPIARSIDLVPKVGFQYFFSNFTEEVELPSGQMSEGNTKLHSLQLSIGVLFGL